MQNYALFMIDLILFFTDKEYDCYSNTLSEYIICHRELLAFPNTVRLRLSLQTPSDLAVLVTRGTLPRIEYLHVTLEKSVYVQCQFGNQHQESSCSSLCPEDFQSSQADLPHLRTLYLRQMAMSDIIVLIQHLASMSQIVSLILVNCYVKGTYRQ